MTDGNVRVAAHLSDFDRLRALELGAWLEQQEQSRKEQEAAARRREAEEAQKRRLARFDAEMERADKIISEALTALRSDTRDPVDWMEVMSLASDEIRFDESDQICLADDADAAKRVEAFFTTAGLSVHIAPDQYSTSSSNASANGIYRLSVAMR